MTSYVALLRGINVGGHGGIRMEALRAIFTAAKAGDPRTYIQSGNVVFTHAARSAATLARALERAIADATGFAVPVVLRTAAEWAAVIANNPFAGADGDHLHVSFLATAPPANALAALDPAGFAPERWQLAGRDLYLCLPGGLGRSKLVGSLARRKPLAAATTRNWRTVQQLQAMLVA